MSLDVPVRVLDEARVAQVLNYATLGTTLGVGQGSEDYLLDVQP